MPVVPHNEFHAKKSSRQGVVDGEGSGTTGPVGSPLPLTLASQATHPLLGCLGVLGCPLGCSPEVELLQCPSTDSLFVPVTDISTHHRVEGSRLVLTMSMSGLTSPGAGLLLGGP